MPFFPFLTPVCTAPAFHTPRDFLHRSLHSILHATGLDERRCAACLTPYSPAQGASLPLCADCLALLPRRKSGYCPHCGEIAAEAMGHEAPSAPCGTCLGSPPPWVDFRFYGVFESLLRDLLHRAKYGVDAAALDVLGQLVAEVCADLPRPDAIVPMPLHPERLRLRGFNQSREIARPVARLFGTPLRDDLLTRLLHVRPQTDLTRRERQHNLDGVFAASPGAAGLTILLIDDTATTGTSLRRGTEALLQAGAAQVTVAVVAHASLHIPHPCLPYPPFCPPFSA